MKILVLLVAFAALAASWASVAKATQPDDAGVKVFVCKYVGTPGEDERLQTGQNPIDVSVNAIPDYQGVGSYFADAQGRSFVLGPEHKASDHVDEPDVSECPEPEGPPETEDVCPNLEGDQDEVPAGYVLDEQGNCVVEEEPPPPGDCSDRSFENGPKLCNPCDEHPSSLRCQPREGGGSSSTGGTTGGTLIDTSGDLPHTGFSVWIALAAALGFIALGSSLIYGPGVVEAIRRRR